MGNGSFGAARAGAIPNLDEPELPEEPQQDLYLLPPMAMPPVQMPVVLVFDQAALAQAHQQLQQMVYSAFKAGMRQAVDEMSDGFDDDEDPVDEGFTTATAAAGATLTYDSGEPPTAARLSNPLR